MHLGRILVRFATLPVVFSDFFARPTGAQYGIGLRSKMALLWKMARNRRRVQTASNLVEHVAMVTKILQIPSSTNGCLVECGTFKGGSAVNLSLAGALCGRKLHIFDSFSGLPAPAIGEESYGSVGSQRFAGYEPGDFSGSLEEVRSNIARFGSLEDCRFHQGYFSDTLPDFREPCAFVFLDVDLLKSLRNCIENLWPLLQDDCCLFTHEAKDYQIASAFYDRAYWESTLGIAPPGLIGAGNGLGLIPDVGGFTSNLGYTVKAAD